MYVTEPLNKIMSYGAKEYLLSWGCLDNLNQKVINMPFR